jgi:hypothetical protein
MSKRARRFGGTFFASIFRIEDTAKQQNSRSEFEDLRTMGVGNTFLWVVTPCESERARRFGGTFFASIFRMED